MDARSERFWKYVGRTANLWTLGGAILVAWATVNLGYVAMLVVGLILGVVGIAGLIYNAWFGTPWGRFGRLAKSMESIRERSAALNPDQSDAQLILNIEDLRLALVALKIPCPDGPLEQGENHCIFAGRWTAYLTWLLPYARAGNVRKARRIEEEVTWFNPRVDPEERRPVVLIHVLCASLPPASSGRGGDRG